MVAIHIEPEAVYHLYEVIDGHAYDGLFGRGVISNIFDEPTEHSTGRDNFYIRPDKVFVWTLAHSKTYKGILHKNGSRVPSVPEDKEYVKKQLRRTLADAFQVDENLANLWINFDIRFEDFLGSAFVDVDVCVYQKKRSTVNISIPQAIHQLGKTIIKSFMEGKPYEIKSLDPNIKDFSHIPISEATENKLQQMKIKQPMFLDPKYEKLNMRYEALLATSTLYLNYALSDAEAEAAFGQSGFYIEGELWKDGKPLQWDDEISKEDEDSLREKIKEYYTNILSKHQLLSLSEMESKETKIGDYEGSLVGIQLYNLKECNINDFDSHRKLLGDIRDLCFEAAANKCGE